MRTRLMYMILAMIICVSTVRMSQATTIVTVAVDPSQVPGRVGKYITFDVYISGIDETVLDLYGWELKVSWVDIEFLLISVEEGSFLQEGGSTFWVPPTTTTSGGIKTLDLGCTLVGAVPGVLGDGPLATITLYVIAGMTGSRFEISDIKLLNSALETIAPPRYDVVVLDEAGEFISAPNPCDLEPTYGIIDIYDLGVVAANYLRNVVRPRKIATSWAVAAATGWSNPQNLLASDELRAASSAAGTSTKWMNFGFNITGWTGVNKVEVGLETYIDSGAKDIVIALSNDNGSSWSGTTFTHNVDTVKRDAFAWIDVTGAYAWTANMIESIAVKLTYQTGGATIRIDYLVVGVTPLPLKSSPDTFDPDADVNNDRVVDIDDLVLCALNYGSYPIGEAE